VLSQLTVAALVISQYGVRWFKNMPPRYRSREVWGQPNRWTRQAAGRQNPNLHPPMLPSTGSTAPSVASVAEITKLFVSSPSVFTLRKLGATWGSLVLGTPMKVFCQSTTPASDSCRAQTDGRDSVQKSRREPLHSEERVCMTPARPEVDDGRG